MRAPIACLLAIALVVAGAAPANARTIGEILDDVRIATEVKTKLAADTLSNLTKISVKSESAIVTLSGTVDSMERRARAAQIAGAVSGVKGLLNNIQVSGAAAMPAASPPVSSAPPPPASNVPAAPTAPMPASTVAVDATGVVTSIDAAAGTITLADGRVLRMSDRTVVWQPTTLGALAPGREVLLRGALPAGFQRGAAETTREWRLGTVTRFDPTLGQLTLDDGTVAQVTSSTNIHRGTQRLTFDDLTPGMEVAVRAPGPTFAANEVNVLWMPPR
jgi:hyperosmotically inducible periplasmic protein